MSTETEGTDPDLWAAALEGLDLVELNPNDCTLRIDNHGNLSGTICGREHETLAVYRSKPLSAPNEWISIVTVDDPDSDGRRSDGRPAGRVELGVLPDTEGLDPESRRAVERALFLRYFIPRVLQILSVHDERLTAAVIWELETNRGRMLLRMTNLFDGIKQLDNGRILLADSEGLRAEIPDLVMLDPASRRLLERYFWF